METTADSMTVSTEGTGVADMLDHNQWRQRGEMIELCGHQMFVMDDGAKDAPVLLLVHGFPTSSWDFAPMWSTLTRHYRVIAMDMLGFGYSDKPNHRRYTIHSQADRFEALIRYKQLETYHVLAHDYGDTVAQEMLARQNNGSGAGQWLSGCFLNGGLFPETHRALLTQKLLLSPLGGWINRLSGFSQFRKNFSSVFGPNTKPTDSELQAHWSVINSGGGKHLFHNLMTYILDRRLNRQRWLEALQTPCCPLALINGSVDPVSGAHMVARYKELNCQLDYLAELPQIGHYPQVEAPDEVAQHYLKFLSGVGK